MTVECNHNTLCAHYVECVVMNTLHQSLCCHYTDQKLLGTASLSLV